MACMSMTALAQHSGNGSDTDYDGSGPFPNRRAQSSYWSGSGIALDSRTVATNHHVVEGATHVYVYFSDTRTRYACEVITVDEEHDLALVRISDPAFQGFPNARFGFKVADEDVGMGVFVLGYPRISTMGEEVKLTTGVLSSRSGYQGDVSLYQVSAPVQNGNSGGPLFNDNGELIGIIVAKHTDGVENVSYAVKLRYLADLVSSAGVNINMNRRSQISSMTLAQKCNEVIPFTVMMTADDEPVTSSSGKRSWNDGGRDGAPGRSDSEKFGEDHRSGGSGSSGSSGSSSSSGSGSDVSRGGSSGSSGSGTNRGSGSSGSGSGTSRGSGSGSSGSGSGSSSSSGSGSSSSSGSGSASGSGSGGSRSGGISSNGKGERYGSRGTYPIRVDRPAVDQANTNYAIVTRIIVDQNQTIVSFAIINPYDGPVEFYIAANAYLQDPATNRRYTVQRASNISLDPGRVSLDPGEILEFQLYFPSVPANVHKLDFIEPGDGGWTFRGINVN